jgi:hypothetical protein
MIGKQTDIDKYDDDDVYLDKLQTKGVKKISPLHVKRRPANKA